jgi:type II secretory pathway component GspD/PulD (secretin)
MGDLAEGPAKEARLTFNFRSQPWEDVLNWFAQQAGFSLVMNSPPQGTFNYTDDRSYTPAEAIDLLNSVLLTKGYTLVLRDRMVVLINLEDGIPPNLVSTVSAKELEQRGDFELVCTLFQLENLRPEEAELEIKKLIGPQGAVVVLPKAQQVLVTETAGRLRTIRDVIERADNPGGAGGEQVQWFDLPPGSAEDVLNLIRQMFNIPTGQTAAADGSLRMAWDPVSMRLLVSAKPGKLEQVSKILQAAVPPGSVNPTAKTVQGTLQLEVYAVYPADPDSALKVAQTLLAGVPGVRLAIDPKTGSLVAYARPSEHATIRATLEQMRRDAQHVEVLQLRLVDPQSAATAIVKLFAADAAKAPAVEADRTTRQLMVRGTEAQVQQIRQLLEKMGETELTASISASGGNVRVLPITGRAAQAALERLQEIWPTMHPNQIRVVTPSAVIPSLRPSGSVPEPPADGAPPAPPPANEPAPLPAPPPPSANPAVPAAPPATPTQTTSHYRWPGRVFHLVADGAPAKPEAEKAASETPPLPPVAKPPAPIVIAPGPNGVVIASEDTKALDNFESLLKTLVGTNNAGDPNMTIFYLKHAKASSVASTLDRVFGGGTLPRDFYTTQTNQSGQPGMPSGMPPGGGMPGPGAPASNTPVNPPAPNQLVQITPDSRLNALIVRASPADVATMEELLKILDQRESPEEILVQPKPRLVPVFNTKADEIVEILKQVYQDRIGSSSSSTSSGQPGMPPMFMMFRGMRGGSGGGGSSSGSRSSDDSQKMSLGVDSRTNSVIVAASEPLFEEVKQFIEQLDKAAIQATNQTMRVVTLHNASVESVEQALSSLVGDSVQVSRSTSGSGAGPASMMGQRQQGTRARTGQSSRSTTTRRSGTTGQSQPGAMPNYRTSPQTSPRSSSFRAR